MLDIQDAFKHALSIRHFKPGELRWTVLKIHSSFCMATSLSSAVTADMRHFKRLVKDDMAEKTKEDRDETHMVKEIKIDESKIRDLSGLKAGLTQKQI